MAVAEGAAATFVAEVARDARDAPVRFVALDGWRVRWSRDGHDILIGVRPARVQDNAPAKIVRRVAVAGGGVSTAPPADSVPWVAGPTLDISVPVARGDRTLHARGRVDRVGGRSDHRASISSAKPAGRHRARWGPACRSPSRAMGGSCWRSRRGPMRSATESPDHAVVYRVP